MQNTVFAHALLIAARNDQITAIHIGDNILRPFASYLDEDCCALVTISVHAERREESHVGGQKDTRHNRNWDFKAIDDDGGFPDRQRVSLGFDAIELIKLSTEERDRVFAAVAEAVKLACDAWSVTDANQKSSFIPVEYNKWHDDTEVGGMAFCVSMHVSQPRFAWTGHSAQQVHKHLEDFLEVVRTPLEQRR